MHIRLLHKKDIQEAAAIVGRNYNREYQRSATRELQDMFGTGPIKPAYFVAVEKGRIIGFAGFCQSYMDYAVWEIFWVNVRPEAQRQGTGKRLVARVIQEIRKRKGAKMMLLTAEIPDYYRDHFGFKHIAVIGGGYVLMSAPVR